MTEHLPAGVPAARGLRGGVEARPIPVWPIVLIVPMIAAACGSGAHREAVDETAAATAAAATVTGNRRS